MICYVRYMMYDFLMIYDLSWCYITIDDIWWHMIIQDNMIIYDSIWLYMILYDDIYDIIWWYMMIYDDIWWYKMIYDDLWWSFWYLIWYDIAISRLLERTRRCFGEPVLDRIWDQAALFSALLAHFGATHVGHFGKSFLCKWIFKIPYKWRFNGKFIYF